MALSFPEIRGFKGLFLQANSFGVPDGAFEILNNYTISKDDIVSKRRGFYSYYAPVGDTVNNLFLYQSKLMGAFNNKMTYFTDTGTTPNFVGSRTTLTGEIVAITSGTSKAIESNKNLYFTSDNGVMKLEAYNSAVFKAGVPQGLDLRGKFYGSSGVIANNKLVGWRIIFGRTDSNSNLLLGVPSEVYTLSNTTGGSRNTRMEASVPSEITSTTDGYFYRLYRSSQVASTSANIFSDFRLADERTLTSAEITAGVLFINDDIDDVLLGEELYTNQNSQEGEAQANYRPPKCEDMTFYKGAVLYLNCETRHLIDFNVVDASSLLSLDFIELRVDSTTRRYVARTGTGNATVGSTTITNSGGFIQIDSAAHGLANGDSVYISNIVAGTLTVSTYFVVSAAAGNFRISTTIGGAAVAFNGETSLDFQGIRTLETLVAGLSWTRTSNVVTVTSAAHGLSVGMVVYITNVAGGTLTVDLYTLTVVTTNTFSFASVGADDLTGNTADYQAHQPQFQLDNASSVSVQLASTARGIVKAIDRDPSSLVYASYHSNINDVPGQIRLQAKGFTGAIYLRGNDSTTGDAFSPVLPSSYSTGTQVFSRNDDLPSTLFAAKLGEPEAVPLANQFDSGASNKQLLRGLALRDSVILLKEDGVYRLAGNDAFNYIITPLDTTVVCIAPESARVVNNQVIFLSNQGICIATESSVQIISRRIEDMIQPILGLSGLSANTGSFGYESERLYALSTMEPNGTSNSVVNVYNLINDTWSTWDTTFTQGIVGPNDTLYLITTEGNIQKERKNQTAIDYCGQQYDVSVVSVAVDLLSAVITVSSSGVPSQHDMIFKEDIFNRIDTATLVSGVTYSVTFSRASNLAAADAVLLYSHYDSRMKLSPVHAGMVGRMKQFTQIQLHFRNNSCTRLQITFTGDTYGSSELVDWESQLTSLGWALFPWGFEPFGQSDTSNLSRVTTPAAICRIYVPRFQQRNTFIQPDITHSKAGEPVNLQAVSFSVRAYMERVSR